MCVPVSCSATPFSTPLHDRTWPLLMLLLWLLLPMASHASTASVFDTPQANASRWDETSTQEARAQDEIPSAQDAFHVSAYANPAAEEVLVSFSLYPRVYLYKHAFKFVIEAENGNVLAEPEPRLPPGKPKHDEIFGDVEVYFDALEVVLPLDAIPLVPARLVATFQGCLEDTLCYPPETRTLPLNFMPTSATDSTTTQAPSSTPSEPAEQGFLATLQSQDANHFQQWMGSHSLVMTVVLFFAGGILLAFTPCVFPMIPILSSIIAGEAQPSAKRGFVLSSAYVLGMALPYTLAGLLVARFGAGMNLQYLLQQPLAIIISAVFFAVLALAMFGLYQLQLPAFLRDRLQQTQQQLGGGSMLNAAVMGAVSALVVSPCVTPILAGALVYVANTGDALTGAITLLALSLGMGLPLILFGTSGGALLPRAGQWMDQVKNFFGVVLLLVAIWLIDRIIPAPLTLVLYGIVLTLYGVQLGALEPISETSSRLKRGVALVIALYGVILLVGGASGGKDPLQPLQATGTSVSAKPDTAVSGAGEKIGIFTNVIGQQPLNQALAEAARNGQPVMVDFFAEWCVSCRVMEETTFSDPEVIDTLAPFVVLRSDITTINQENRAIMEQFNIVGLPSIHFYNSRGEEIPDSRIMGEMNPAEFLQFYQRTLAPHLP